MYIIEFIAKLLKEKHANSRNVQAQADDTELETRCAHTFFPIDSTGQTLACSKCGLVKKAGELKVNPKNPFS